MNREKREQLFSNILMICIMVMVMSGATIMVSLAIKFIEAIILGK